MISKYEILDCGNNLAYLGRFLGSILIVVSFIASCIFLIAEIDDPQSLIGAMKVYVVGIIVYAVSTSIHMGLEQNRKLRGI